MPSFTRKSAPITFAKVRRYTYLFTCYVQTPNLNISIFGETIKPVGLLDDTELRSFGDSNCN